MAESTPTLTPSTAAAINSPAKGAGSDALQKAGTFLKRGDLALAFAVMGIIVVLILPMPAWMLDMLLAISIILSVLIMMTALFIEKSLEFSSFPTVLLIATMLRLALNLASTRLILANGHTGTDAAGSVIEAFGSFVMGGNFVIGVIVFAILVIVNFVVITKGSGRIAEVAARFTLDAMPGKQMAIDADLSAGMISEDDARARRKELENEAAFYGAMDGASKFVRGDAIAGLLITFINVIGGIIIGTMQQGISLGEASSTYTLLTVGDGLVSQIPALIVSTAAGLLVSKAGVTGAANKALGEQLSNYPKALWMSSLVMTVMAFLPGIPIFPFLSLGLGAGATAFLVDKKAKEAKSQKEREAIQKETATEETTKEEPITEQLKIDDIKIEVGYGLVSLMQGNSAMGERLPEQIKALRRQLVQELGFILPSVRIVDNAILDNHTYQIKIKEVVASTGQVFPDRQMAMDPNGNQISLPGIAAKEPAFELDVIWIDNATKEDAQMKGLTVVDAPTVITTHLTEVIKSHMAELLSYADVQKLLNELSQEQQKLIEDIVPTQITISGIQRILQNLLKERISIRDLGSILEGIAEATNTTRNPNAITEVVRTRLARQISSMNINHDGAIPLITLSHEWEQAFNESLFGDGEEKQLAMAPSKLHEFVNAVKIRFEEAARMGELPVLLVSPQIRPHVRNIIERFRAQTIVMSQNEIHPRSKLKTVGVV